MKLLVATRNQGKLIEIRRGLADCGWEVTGLDSYPDLPEIEEDGETFEANACKKALTVARLTGELTLADDSGLAVDALRGEPGVRSARYAGEQACDSDNNQLLLRKLGEFPESERKAAFHCVMALCSPDGDCRTFSGEVHGHILAEPRGEKGFGYDPLFFVPSHGRSMAELPLELKNSISHRGAALRQVIAYLASSGRSVRG